METANRGSGMRAFADIIPCSSISCSLGGAICRVNKHIRPSRLNVNALLNHVRQLVRHQTPSLTRVRCTSPSIEDHIMADSVS